MSTTLYTIEGRSSTPLKWYLSSELSGAARHAGPPSFPIGDISMDEYIEQLLGDDAVNKPKLLLRKPKEIKHLEEEIKRLEEEIKRRKEEIRPNSLPRKPKEIPKSLKEAKRNT